MPTLRRPVKRKEKANTSATVLAKARIPATRKGAAKRKAAKEHSWARFVTERSIHRDDVLDARLIRQARRADRGKRHFSINELRAQRGLSAI